MRRLRRAILRRRRHDFDGISGLARSQRRLRAGQPRRRNMTRRHDDIHVDAAERARDTIDAKRRWALRCADTSTSCRRAYLHATGAGRLVERRCSPAAARRRAFSCFHYFGLPTTRRKHTAFASMRDTLFYFAGSRPIRGGMMMAESWSSHDRARRRYGVSGFASAILLLMLP